MFNLESETNLDFLVGATLIQVGLGENEIVLRFFPDASISIEGAYLAGKSEPARFDRAPDGASELAKLIGPTVDSYAVSPRSDLEVSFANGGTVVALNSSRSAECFQITHSGSIWVV